MSSYKYLIAGWWVVISGSLFAASPLPINGYWKTIDDETGRAKAILEITNDSDNQLQGRIIRVFHEPGKTPLRYCTLCKGDKKNQPIVGMVIMNGLKSTVQYPSHWEGGTITDPRSGKEYQCQLDYDTDKNQVKIRGYIGLPLLGRTQIWRRVTSLTISDPT